MPKGILRSVFCSGLFGWFMVASFVLAMPSVSDAAEQGANVFPWLMEQVAARRARQGAVGRHRDRELPVRSRLRHFHLAHAIRLRAGRRPAHFRAPCAAFRRRSARLPSRSGRPRSLCVASTLYAPAYSTLTTACVIFLYLSYVMPTAIGVFAIGKQVDEDGALRPRRPLYKALAVVAVLGVALLVWIGVQPPNDKALGGAHRRDRDALRRWWLGVNKRFQGPPKVSLIADK